MCSSGVAVGILSLHKQGCTIAQAVDCQTSTGAGFSSRIPVFPHYWLSCHKCCILMCHQELVQSARGVCSVAFILKNILLHKQGCTIAQAIDCQTSTGAGFSSRIPVFPHYWLSCHKCCVLMCHQGLVWEDAVAQGLLSHHSSVERGLHKVYYVRTYITYLLVKPKHY